MKQILIENDIIGKTILKVIDTDYHMILFSDDTFCAYETEDDSSYIRFVTDIIDLNPTVHNVRMLVDMGLLSKERQDKFYEEFEASRRADNIKHDLETLARLKAKYEKAAI